MSEKVMLYNFCGKLTYGVNIGKAYLKNSRIIVPDETLQAIRENSVGEECILDTPITLHPNKSFGFGIMIGFEETQRKYDEFNDEIHREMGYSEDVIKLMNENTPSDVFYMGKFEEAMMNMPQYLLEKYLESHCDDNASSEELTIGYIERSLSGQKFYREFYIVNMNSDKWIYRNIPYRQFIEEQKERGRFFEMHLNDEPYYKILSGIKIYELRLLDEKRQMLREGDVIRFDKLDSENDKDCFYTIIKDLKKYDSFSDLYDAGKNKEDNLTLYRCGSSKNVKKEDFLKRMESFYPVEKQDKYSVVALELEVIDSPETERRINVALENASKRRQINNSLNFSNWDHFSGLYFRAICMAELAHRGTKRKMSDVDFICHPVEVASIVHDVVYRSETPAIQIINRVIAAAALHDVVEDTDYTIKDIEEVFYEQVAELVAEETEDKRREQKPKDTWRIRKEEFLNKLAASPDFARLICLGDKLSNMRDMLLDYEELGDKLWDKFNNNNMIDHAWYYKNVVEELGKPNKERDFIVDFELSETKEYSELRSLVEEIFGK